MAFMDMAISHSLWQALVPWGLGALLGATISILTMGWAFKKNRVLQQALLKAEFEQALQSQAFATQRAQEQLNAAEDALTEARQTNLALQGSQALLQTEVAVLKNELETQKNLAKSAEAQWEKNFHAFLTDTLQQAKTQFKQQVSEEHHDKAQALDQKMQAMIKPITEMLEGYQARIESLDKTHLSREVALREHLAMLQASQKELTSVLKTNKGAGTWGELQLLRLLELSGLQEGVHFDYQSTELQGRPDFKIYLPERGFVYVDAKTLQLTAEEAALPQDPAMFEQYQAKLLHSLRVAIKDLSKKDYTQGQDHTTNYVVLFVPMESMLSLAWQAAPSLWDEAFRQNVILSTPLNLIALLKTIRFSWHQFEHDRDARQVQKLGRDLHDKLTLFVDRMITLSKRLEAVCKAYSDAETSLTGKSGLVSKTKRLAELGCSSNKSLPSEAVDFDLIEGKRPLADEALPSDATPALVS